MQHRIDLQDTFFSFLEKGQYAAAADILSDNCEFLIPGHRPYKGKRNIIRLFRSIGLKYSKISWLVTNHFYAPPNWIFCTWNVQGIFFGNEEEYRNSGISMMRIDEFGKVDYVSDFFKSTSFVTTRRRDFR